MSYRKDLFKERREYTIVSIYQKIVNFRKRFRKFLSSQQAPKIKTHGKASDRKMIKSNSCSTLFLDDTIETPNKQHLIEYMATFVYRKIILSRKRLKIADERKVQEVYNFLYSIYRLTPLTTSCAIITLIYIDRLLAYKSTFSSNVSWRNLLLGIIMIACKVWYDEAIWNADFIHMTSHGSLRDLKELERHCLKALRFDLMIKASIYALYYFKLQEQVYDFASVLEGQIRYPLSPSQFELLNLRTNVTENSLKAQFWQNIDFPLKDKLNNNSKRSQSIFRKVCSDTDLHLAGERSNSTLNTKNRIRTDLERSLPHFIPTKTRIAILVI
jgi:hypothetical protein